MRPTLRPAGVALFKRCRRYKAGQVVVAGTEGREIVKRLLAVGKNKAYLQGDHPDSADYVVPPADLRGRLLLKLHIR